MSARLIGDQAMTRSPTKKPTKATGKKVSLPVRRAAEHAGGDRGTADVGPLFERIVSILEEARAEVVRSVNSAMVLAYWQIGREIVEYYQAGAVRAEYGDQLLKVLSARLQRRVGRGYSVTNLRYFRLFYQTYAKREATIRHKPCDELLPDLGKHHKARDVSAALDLAASTEGGLAGFSARLSWSHYRALTKVSHAAERAFYEIEAELENWSVPQLERQIHTHLFARLLKSRDKAGVLDLAARGQVLERPADAIKHPYVLDFLDLPESTTLRESDLESAILEKLQHFLLEIGKGFAFVARQKRLSFEDEHFYVDLVFYNVILKCYLLIDLKLGKLTHQDVGQMDSYVRLFDEQGRTEGDGPTIGLILCAEKNEAVARYSVLHENEQLFAAKYLLYLPSVEELERELARERRQLDRRTNEGGGAAPTAVRRGRRSDQQPVARSPRGSRAKKKGPTSGS
jgi:predicted nuclease of restriction endonuclease-like (RecB) superfamily